MPTPSDIVEIESPWPFLETLAKLSLAIEAAGLNVFASIDHAAGAAALGMSMPPTVVLIYGHAKGGTPIMQAQPRAALDLPLKVLAREADGKTLVAFHPVSSTLEKAGVPAHLASRLEPAQRLIAAALSG